MLDDLPVFGICGLSGSGKTTLLEALVPRLRERDLEVALVKRDAHGLDLDRAGKDSDRLFLAGADVFITDPRQSFARRRLAGAPPSPPLALAEIASRYDLVLVEGYKDLPVAKVWLLRPGEEAPPEGPPEVIAYLPREGDRASATIRILQAWLPARWRRPPVYGCLLIGGASRRMGRPKHLLPREGRTWLERTHDLLRRATEIVVIVGKGEVPPSLAGGLRLPDAPGVPGPLAGILAATRWAPRATWLVAACDLPDLSEEALTWLLASRAPGVWATVPRREGSAGFEPLLAHYDLRGRRLLERLAAEGNFRPSGLASHAKVATPTPPPEVAPAWRNVNTAADLQASSVPRP